MKPVHAYSFQGKFLVALLRFLLFFVHLVKGKSWQRPVKNFTEDPLHYSKLDILYFAYKYYYHGIETYDDGSAELKPGPAFIQPSPEANASYASITAAGDLMPYEWMMPEYCKHLWEDIGQDFFSSDIVLANLETPVDLDSSPGFVPEVMLNDMEFNASAEMFRVFNGNENYKGFDVLSTANNHSYDKGEQGIGNTMKFLSGMDIRPTGTAASQKEVNDFPILERNGIRIAFLAITYSLNHLELPADKRYLCNHINLNQPGCDLGLLKQLVLMAHQRGADFVVASVHYGNAYQLFPSEHIIDVTSRMFRECGVDLVLGVHSHNIQPFEIMPFTCPITGRSKQGLVFYGLGDFAAYDIFTWAHLPVYVKLLIRKGREGAVISNFEIIPVYTFGNYESNKQRELKFLDARKLWKQLETGAPPAFMGSFHQREAAYLAAIYKKVFAS
jgi:poly-gamma-glutamate capsule biosynthesis protein CapA/YwtB (metallophosphatase superfamily)